MFNDQKFGYKSACYAGNHMCITCKLCCIKYGCNQLPDVALAASLRRRFVFSFCLINRSSLSLQVKFNLLPLVVSM